LDCKSRGGLTLGQQHLDESQPESGVQIGVGRIHGSQDEGQHFGSQFHVAVSLAGKQTFSFTLRRCQYSLLEYTMGPFTSDNDLSIGAVQGV
jgi:hypothetical protein